jgi:proteasome lid subunit RPN8/RPN11
MPDTLAPRSVTFDSQLLRAFVADAVRAHPRKTFGLFLSSQPYGDPEEYVVMRTNERRHRQEDFAPYGRYFTDHADAGFVCSPEETLLVERYVREHDLHPVGVFHTHKRHPALLTSVDADFHPAPHLWHLILVLRNPQYPQVRVFAVEPRRRIRELRVVEAAGEPAW